MTQSTLFMTSLQRLIHLRNEENFFFLFHGGIKKKPKTNHTV